MTLSPFQLGIAVGAAMAVAAAWVVLVLALSVVRSAEISGKTANKEK